MSDEHLPMSEPAERAMLGSMICDPACVPLVRRIIRAPAALVQEQHRKLFVAVCELHERFAERFDYIALGEHLDTSGALEGIGGLDYLWSLFDSVGSSAHAEYYARTVWRKYLLRQTLSALHAAIERARSLPDIEEPHEFLHDVAQSILMIAAEGHRSEAAFERIAEACAAEALAPIPVRYHYGLETLDSILPPIEPGDYIVIGARPSHGKTTLAINIAANIARDPNGCPVAVYSLEVRRSKLARQVVARFQNISAGVLERGDIPPEDQAAVIHTAAMQIPDGRLFLIDDIRNVGQVCADAAARCRVNRIGVVFIDYLQLLGGPTTVRHKDRFHEVTAISQSLKGLAVNEGLVVVALAQLSRALEQRPDKMPRMSDLRESGQIEQDADVVLMLTRLELYSRGEVENGRVIVVREKVRDGSAGGMFRLGFDGKRRIVFDLPEADREFIMPRRTATTAQPRSGNGVRYQA